MPESYPVRHSRSISDILPTPRSHTFPINSWQVTWSLLLKPVCFATEEKRANSLLIFSISHEKRAWVSVRPQQSAPSHQPPAPGKGFGRCSLSGRYTPSSSAERHLRQINSFYIVLPWSSLIPNVLQCSLWSSWHITAGT